MLNFIKRLLGIKVQPKIQVITIDFEANKEYYNSLGKSNWN